MQIEMGRDTSLNNYDGDADDDGDGDDGDGIHVEEGCEDVRAVLLSLIKAGGAVADAVAVQL